MIQSGSLKCRLLDKSFIDFHSVVPKFLLAPSDRILAYLARRAHQSPLNMAVATREHLKNASANATTFLPPPSVVTTPCDPWPRPYYLENGLRRVLPYHYTYNTYCKERWRGRELLDIFVTEFRDRPLEYYVRRFPASVRDVLKGIRKTL